MEQVELKPCPFCGGEAQACENTFIAPKGSEGMHWVLCGACHAGPGDRSTPAAAIAAWNARTTDQAKDEEIARYREALEHIVSIYPEETGGMSDAALAGLLFNAANAARQALGGSCA